MPSIPSDHFPVLESTLGASGADISVRWIGLVVERLPAADRFDPLHPDRRLKEICDRHEIPCLLMAEDFRQRAPSRLSTTREEWLFFHGAGHLNQAGHRAAAENLYRFLVGQQLLKVATIPGRNELLFKRR